MTADHQDEQNSAWGEWLFVIGGVEIIAESLPFAGDDLYLAPHKFIVRLLDKTLTLYMAPGRRHYMVSERFPKTAGEIVGGGSCFLNADHLLVLGDFSGDFGAVPKTVAQKFVGLLRPILEKRNITIKGVLADPDEAKLWKHWARAGLANKLAMNTEYRYA